jgi:hypothetical protein
MSHETEELIRICESLPSAKRSEVTDFARFLAAREDDAHWEGIINDSASRPRLESFLQESAVEGESPLDLIRL